MPQEKLSIKSFKDIFLEKMKSGSWFLILNSNISKNLENYTNNDEINFNSINFNKFEEINVNYFKVISLEKNKIIGITDSTLEVYDIKEKTVITSVKLNTDRKSII